MDENFHVVKLQVGKPFPFTMPDNLKEGGLIANIRHLGIITCVMSLRVYGI